MEDYKQTAIAVAQLLDCCSRAGADKDSPEGSRYIQISDTLARNLADALRKGFFETYSGDLEAATVEIVKMSPGQFVHF